MALSWDESSFGRPRALAGDGRTLISVGARCVVRDGTGRVLLVRRADSGTWALPAGMMELGESLRDCAVREVLPARHPHRTGRRVRGGAALTDLAAFETAGTFTLE